MPSFQRNTVIGPSTGLNATASASNTSHASAWKRLVRRPNFTSSVTALPRKTPTFPRALAKPPRQVSPNHISNQAHTFLINIWDTFVACICFNILVELIFHPFHRFTLSLIHHSPPQNVTWAFQAKALSDILRFNFYPFMVCLNFKTNSVFSCETVLEQGWCRILQETLRKMHVEKTERAASYEQHVP